MRTDHRVICLVASAALLAACKDDPKSRSAKIVDSNDFWPDAPKATKGSEARTFKYNPESVKAYAIVVDIGTSPGAEANVNAKMTMGIAFDAGKAPRARDAKIQGFDMDMNAAGQRMKMHLDHDSITVDDGAGNTTKFQRGQPGIFDVAAVVDTPIETMTFTEANKVESVFNPDHPFSKFGGDSLDNAMMLFPDLPSEPVKPGSKWTMTRMYAPGSGIGKFPVTFEFEYVGDSACPSGAKACAQLQFTASSSNVDMSSGGMTGKVSFGFAGKVFFDTARGAIDESRVRLDMDIKADGHSLPMGGNMAIKTVKS